MDNNTLINASITSGIVSIIYALYKIFKHSKCSSNCCGRTSDVSIDLTPPRESFTPKPTVQS